MSNNDGLFGDGNGTAYTHGSSTTPAPAGTEVRVKDSSGRETTTTMGSNNILNPIPQKK